MVNFKKATGNLFVGKSAKNSDRISGESQNYLYEFALFRSKDFNIVLSSGIGRYYPVKENDIVDNTYYPYFNEAKCTIETIENDNVELFKENVNIEFAVFNDEMFIKSDSEITAYGGFYLVINEQVYKVHNSLLVNSSEDSGKDNVLNIEPVSNAIKVENMNTNYILPVNETKIRDIVESDAKNGALRIREPENIKYHFLKNIKDN